MIIEIVIFDLPAGTDRNAVQALYQATSEMCEKYRVDFGNKILRVIR
ncbi:hypothetical protein [Acidocella aminolytica]|nr:hypothetical protein [Acidocella aminolytica]